MRKEASFSELAPSRYATPFTGPGIISNPSTVLKLIQQDHGLDSHKKNSLFTILNSPEAFDHIMIGLTGAAIGKAVAHYSEMSKPARVLLSLAGFGIGNIIYNTLHERKFTSYDPHTGVSKIII